MEYKFRAIDEFSDDFIYAPAFFVSPDNDQGYLAYDIDKHYLVKKDTVGVFIGKTDRNGVDVYENDYDSDGNIVIWCNTCSGWQFGAYDIQEGEMYINCHCCEGSFTLRNFLPHFEIAGNIHQ